MRARATKFTCELQIRTFNLSIFDPTVNNDLHFCHHALPECRIQIEFGCINYKVSSVICDISVTIKLLSEYRLCINYHVLYSSHSNIFFGNLLRTYFPLRIDFYKKIVSLFVHLERVEH